MPHRPHPVARCFRALVPGVGPVALALSAAIGPWAAGAEPIAVFPEQSVGSLRLLQTAFGHAVFRAPNGALERIAPGALVGSSRAVVVAIEPGRVVLEEVVRGADGRPTQARVIFDLGASGPARIDHAPPTIQPPLLAPRGIP